MKKFLFNKNSFEISNLKFQISLVSLICYLLYAPQTHASSTSLSISPPIIKIETIGKTNIKTPITIKNKSNKNLIIQIIFKPFKASAQDNGEIDYLSNKDTIPYPDKSILKKIQILNHDEPINEFELGPQQTKTLSLEIKLPKKEPPADYYYSIIFLSSSISEAKKSSVKSYESKNQKPITNNQSFAQSGIATNLLLSIGERTEPKAYIEKFSSDIFLQSGPVNFLLKVKNPGPQMINPAGMILISNMFGQTIGRIDIPSTNILSNSQRYLTNSQEKLSSSTTIIWPEKILLGPYTAKIQLKISEKYPLQTRSINFIVLPLQGIIAITIIILITISLYLGIHKKLNNK